MLIMVILVIVIFAAFFFLGKYQTNTTIQTNRHFLKDFARLEVDFSNTPQRRQMPAPPLQKAPRPQAQFISLPNGIESLEKKCQTPLATAILSRASLRDYDDLELSLEELTALLHGTQGVREVLSPSMATRVVPSAGARHAFESYIVVNRVETLEKGIYRFLPFENRLEIIGVDEQVHEQLKIAAAGQSFVAGAACVFFWTVIPERMEWRYDLASHKFLAIEAGHVCQNLYLTATAMGWGACAVGIYDQKASDELLKVDGQNEFTIYLAAVGHRSKPATR